MLQIRGSVDGLPVEVSLEDESVVVRRGGALRVVGRLLIRELVAVEGDAAAHTVTFVSATEQQAGWLRWLAAPGAAIARLVVRGVAADVTMFAVSARAHCGLLAVVPRAERRRWLAIANPASGNGHALRVCNAYVLPVMVAAGYEVALRCTERPGHARSLATLADDDGCSVYGLISCGGDGLLNEVLNGNVRGRNVPMAVIPAGTDNAIAVSLNLRSPLTAVLALVRGEHVAVDALSVQECRAEDGVAVGDPLYALTTCYAGFMSDALADMEANRWLGKARVAVCGLRHGLRPAQPYDIHVKWKPRQTAHLRPCTWPHGEACPDCLHSGGGLPPALEADDGVAWRTAPPGGGMSCVLVGLHPAKTHAVSAQGGMWRAAHLADGLLDLVVLPAQPWLKVMEFMAHVNADMGQADMPEVEYAKATQVVLSCPSGEVPFAVDGELVRVASNAVLCKVLPSLVQIVAPTPELRTPPHRTPSLCAQVANRGVFSCLGLAWSCWSTCWLGGCADVALQRKDSRPTVI